MKCNYTPFFVFVSLCATAVGGRAQETLAAPREFSLASAAPSGIAVNDQIPLRYFAPTNPAGTKSPAVVLLHHLGGSGDDRQLDKFVVALNKRGIAALALTLPYCGRRRVPGTAARQYYVGDAGTVAQAFEQSASDVTTAVTWLAQQPEIDANRIGAVGVSLGAFVLHLAMGRDERINAGVAALGAGNLAGIFLKTPGREPNAQEIETLRPVDPLTYADRNRPRRVLMIQAARDNLIPPRYSQQLWEALGRPPIQWADVSHHGLVLTLNSTIKTTVAYLETAWSDSPNNLSRVPRVRAIPIKAGFLSGMGTTVTPALQVQVLSIGTRKHMALLSANAGLGLRGPFVGMAATVNRHVDIGLGRRIFGGDIRPYVSFHTVF